MRLTKMQGLGNDFLLLRGPVPDGAAECSRRLCSRRFGVGADGLIFVTPSEHADLGMRIFNSDGSEAQMCGNGIRCLGKYAYETGLTDRTLLRVETRAGIKTLALCLQDGRVTKVKVQMGSAAVSEALELEGARLIPVDMGNPHAVVFVENAETAPVSSLGPRLERHPAFPDGVNVEFVQPLSPTLLRMRVWERGCGITMACGTGACASVAAAVAGGLCRADTPVRVRLDGGELEICVAADGSVTMCGPAETVFEGEFVL